MQKNVYQTTVEAIGAAKMASVASPDKDPLKLVLLEQIALNLAAIADAQTRQSVKFSS